MISINERGVMKMEACDNTDCEGNFSKEDLKKVEMRTEFGGEKAIWCKDCIERDKDMIK